MYKYIYINMYRYKYMYLYIYIYIYVYRVPSLCEIEVFDARRVRVELGQHLALEACILCTRETN